MKSLTMTHKHVLKKLEMGTLVLIFMFISMLTVPTFGYEDFGEIQDIGMKSSMQAMRSFEVHWTNYVFYT